MNRRSLNIIFISILILSNLVLAGFILFRKPPHPPKPREIIIRKLNFDKEQAEKYDLLIKAHQESIIVNEKKMLSLKNGLYGSLSKNGHGSNSDSLSLEIGKIQTEMERIHYSHFLEIKKLCKAEQLPAFEALTVELAKMFSRPQMKRK